MITNKDKNIMLVLRGRIEAHVYSDNYRLAASLIYKKRIFYGFNKPKTHPLAARFQKHPEAIDLHAELDAIRNALRFTRGADLTSSTLYVGRLRFSDPRKSESVWGLALPCKGCMDAIETFDISRVVYSTNDQEFGELRRDS